VAGRGADLTSGNGPAVWARFAARQDAARAAWLARTFPPVVGPAGISVARPATTRSEPRVNRIVGLPPALELWLARGGNPPALVTTLVVDRSALALDFPDPAAGIAPWWSSFATAKAVGLGVELDIGAADDIDALYVVGLGAATRSTCSRPTVTAGRCRSCRWGCRPTPSTGNRPPTSAGIPRPGASWSRAAARAGRVPSS
jgi:hypothetical protein